MNKPEIEEQLRAIEAALDLTQARHLPVAIPSSKPAVNPDSFDDYDAARAREMALVILKRFDERIAGIEQENMSHRQHQAYTHVVQQEQQEAIELVSEELAALKKRTAQMEGWLRNMHIKSSTDRHHKEHREMRQGYIWTIFAVLIMVLFVFLLAAFRP